MKNHLLKSAAQIYKATFDRENGGFYSAQDADSEGVEGKYYLFSKQEVIQVLGVEKGVEFCEFYDISSEGNFEGKNIVNLLKNENFQDGFADEKRELYEYRKNRYHFQSVIQCFYWHC